MLISREDKLSMLIYMADLFKESIEKRLLSKTSKTFTSDFLVYTGETLLLYALLDYKDRQKKKSWFSFLRKPRSRFEIHIERFLKEEFSDDMADKKKRNFKKEYQAYHASEKQKKNRASRNAARAKMAKKGKVHKGDGNDVTHKSGNPKNNADSNLGVQVKSKNRSFKRTKSAGKKNKKD